MGHHWYLSLINLICHLMTILLTIRIRQWMHISQHIRYQIKVKLSINLAIFQRVVYRMIDGYVLFVLTYFKMLLKHHVAITYSVLIVSDRPGNAHFATSVLLANLSQISLSDALCWSYQ